MCESTAYLMKDGREELFFEDVDALDNQGEELRLTNIFGEEKKIAARIRQFSLVDHKIFLEPC